MERITEHTNEMIDYWEDRLRDALKAVEVAQTRLAELYPQQEIEK